MGIKGTSATNHMDIEVAKAARGPAMGDEDCPPVEEATQLMPMERRAVQ